MTPLEIEVSKIDTKLQSKDSYEPSNNEEPVSYSINSLSNGTKMDTDHDDSVKKEPDSKNSKEKEIPKQIDEIIEEKLFEPK